MATEAILINGVWQDSQDLAGTFQANDPTLGQAIDTVYPVSGLGDVELAVKAAYEAVVALRSKSAEDIAAFLEAYASEIEARGDALVDMAYAETGLPKSPRLKDVELPRTTGQLRQGAQAARDGSWAMATIDTASNIRSMLGPLDGSVVVFGPNNFPFAFNSIAGGDFAAAIAAGNPVIGKANTGHPGTSKIFAEAALAAMARTDITPYSPRNHTPYSPHTLTPELNAKTIASHSPLNLTS